MLTATLVENARVDGKVQQKHLLQLGSISTKQHWTWDTPAYNAARFWMYALDRMHLAGIPLDVQAKAVTAVETKVPRPSEEDLRCARKEHLAFVREYYRPEYAARYEAWYQECGV